MPKKSPRKPDADYMHRILNTLEATIGAIDVRRQGRPMRNPQHTQQEANLFAKSQTSSDTSDPTGGSSVEAVPIYFSSVPELDVKGTRTVPCMRCGQDMARGIAKTVWLTDPDSLVPYKQFIHPGPGDANAEHGINCRPMASYNPEGGGSR